tara:strand:+ start:446 stop:664 length:219 start_codon:yes stop_codon:yes gene_type:complete
MKTLKQILKGDVGYRFNYHTHDRAKYSMMLDKMDEESFKREIELLVESIERYGSDSKDDEAKCLKFIKLIRK